MKQVGLTAKQMHLMTLLNELQVAKDWLGIVALEHDALSLEMDFREADSGAAGTIHGILGLGLERAGQYAQTLELLAGLGYFLPMESGLTKEQLPLVTQLNELNELQAVADWRVIVMLEHESMALARDVRVSHPRVVGTIHSMLGLGFMGVGQYARALAMHAEDKASSEALGETPGS